MTNGDAGRTGVLLHVPPGERTACRLGAVLLAAGLLAACSSSSGDSPTGSGATGASPLPAAGFHGAYSGTLTPAVCRDTVVDVLAKVGSRTSTGSIDNAFPVDPTSTRYRITLYNLGSDGTVFAQAPHDAKYVPSTPDRNRFFLDGIVLISNTSPRLTITLSGTLACS